MIENSTDIETKNTVKDIFADYRDERMYYVDEYFTDRERKEKYPTAVLLNKYYDLMTGDFMFYISDDDVLEKDCFKEMIESFDSNSEIMVNWHGQMTVDVRDRGQQNTVSTRNADYTIMAGTTADCVIDGGVIMFRRECLNEIEKPYYVETYPEAGHCDGLFMNKLNKKWSFFPVRKVLSTHRRTKLSTWDRI